MKKIVIAVWVLLWGLSSGVFAQSQSGSDLVGDYFSKKVDAYGQSLVPAIILPGFLMGTPEDDQSITYPIYSGVLKSDYPLQLNRTNLQDIQISELVSAPTGQVAEVVIFSSELADNRTFTKAYPVVDLVVISERLPVVSLTVNDRKVQFDVAPVVEVDVKLSLKKGANKILIAGMLSNNMPFSKTYNILHDRIITDVSEKSWNLSVSAALGHDSNLSKSLSETHATAELGHVYGDPESGFFWKAGATLFDELTENVDWYVGGVLLMHGKDYEDSDYTLGYAALNYRQNALLYSGWGAFFSTGDGDGYSSLNAEITFDFNYSKDAHSGWLAGANISSNYLPGDKVGVGYYLFARYNGYYLVDWISLVVFNSSVGRDEYGKNEGREYDFFNFGVLMVWNKTFWDFYASLDTTFKNYPNQRSLILGDETTKRSDQTIIPAIKYNYGLRENWGAYIECSYIINRSNYLPHDKLVVVAGTDYIF